MGVSQSKKYYRAIARRNKWALDARTQNIFGQVGHLCDLGNHTDAQ